MNTVRQEVALKFCELCDWAYQCWVNHRCLFDDNGDIDGTVGRASYFAARLSIITQEYTLLQICKLHDPALQKGRHNVCIEYFAQYGDWGDKLATIEALKTELGSLFSLIKSARNKLLVHNDLTLHLGSSELGRFQDGMDLIYFSTLQRFANEVHMKWCGSPYQFSDFAKADAQEFLTMLKKA